MWTRPSFFSSRNDLPISTPWFIAYLNSAVYFIKTDFGRLAKRYEAVRNAKLEELKRKYPYAGRDEEERRQESSAQRG